MFFVFIWCSCLIIHTMADDRIIHVLPGCPSNYNGRPEPQVRADIPAHATAICKNGKRTFTTTNDVKYTLEATMNQGYIGNDCLYFKKNGSNTFTINVEISWGEKGSEVQSNQEIHTISCAFDDHGKALSSSAAIGKSFLAPKEKQYLKGKAHSTAAFKMVVVDVRGNELDTDHLQIGRLIRLKASDTSGTVTAFRALSCFASNPVTSYAILRAGCGDGLILDKSEGFMTDKNKVYSPFFEAFKLRGAEIIKFDCNFTVCSSKCDGDSCPAESKRKRRSADREQSELIADDENEQVQADTAYMWAKPPARRVNPSVDPAISPTRPPVEPPVKPPVKPYVQTIATARDGDFIQVGNRQRLGCPKFLDQHLSPEAEYTIVAVLAVFGSLLLLNFLICLYLCCKVEVTLIERRKH